MHALSVSRLLLSIQVATWCLLATSCSDFLLNNKDKDGHSRLIISARTMDYEIDLKTQLEVLPANTEFQELPVANGPKCPNYSWKSKYGMVALNAVGLNAATDGMNEKGLSAAFLQLDASEFPMPNTSDSRPMISNLCSYIMGNFASVEEVEEGLKTIQPAAIDGPLLETLLNVPKTPLLFHIAVHDASGKNLVIEFIKGKITTSRNPNGVLTNDPPLNMQLKNLQQRNDTLKTMSGDYSPTSRFIRLSVLNKQAAAPYIPGTSYAEATAEQRDISKALHVIDTVILPPGGSISNPQLKAVGATEWTLVRDHSSKKLYFRSTENQMLRMINFAQLNFRDPASRKAASVRDGNWNEDVTAWFKSNSNEQKTMDLPPRQTIVEFGGLMTQIPLYTGVLIGIFLSIMISVAYSSFRKCKQRQHYDTIA